MNLFLLLLRVSWRTAVLATLAGILSGVSMLGLIALIHTALSQDGRAPGTLAGAFAALCMVAFLARVGSQALLVRLSQRTVSAMSQTLCRQVLDTPLARLEQVGPHRILATLTGDVGVIAMAMNGIPTLCVNLATLVCGVAYLGWLSTTIAVASVVLLVLGIVSYRATEARAVRYLKLARDDQDQLMKHLRSLIHGIKELKLHRNRREAFLTRALAMTDESLRGHQTKGLTIQAIAVTWGRLLFFVAIGLLVFGLPNVRAVDGKTLGGVTLTILYLTGPVESIIGWLPVLARARIALNKVDELGVSLEPGGEARGAEMPGALAPVRSWSRLDLSGVVHAYRGEREDLGFLLGPINLTLQPGELTFVIGGNGSGKTTLIKLITGLYSPENGSIRLDDREISDADREQFRQLFSVVFADVNLFETLFGLESVGLDAKALDYLAQLHLEHKVRVDEGVFSTTSLSKGQRKRLALVTAYLEDRPIYVFDEWAADQDPLFKDVFYTRILPELRTRGKCVVAVTHDEGYFHLADRIVRLRDGKIIDETWDDVHQPYDESLAGPA